MAKANLEVMQGLHGILAEYYKDYMSVALKDGEEVSSGFLAALNTFLKNNSITVDVVESDTMMDLGAELRGYITQKEVV